MRVTFFGLIASLVLSGCSHFIPIDAPDPYSDSLADYLSQPRLNRAGVQRWLGPPDTTRMDGKYEVYLALREQARDLLQSPWVAYHYLLVEYDGRDQVIRHDELVNWGCTADNLCIAALTWQSPFKQDLDELKSSAIDQFALYASPDMDQQAKDSLTSPTGCRRFIYRSEGSAMVRLVDLVNLRAVLLPADGFLVFAGECEARQIRVAWSSWNGEFEERLIEMGGAAAGSTVIRLDLQKVEFWGWKYSLTAVDQSGDEGMNEIRSRRLVLR